MIYGIAFVRLPSYAFSFSFRIIKSTTTQHELFSSNFAVQFNKLFTIGFFQTAIENDDKYFRNHWGNNKFNLYSDFNIQTNDNFVFSWKF